MAGDFVAFSDKYFFTLIKEKSPTSFGLNYFFLLCHKRTLCDRHFHVHVRSITLVLFSRNIDFSGILGEPYTILISCQFWKRTCRRRPSKVPFHFMVRLHDIYDISLQLYHLFNGIILLW